MLPNQHRLVLTSADGRRSQFRLNHAVTHQQRARLLGRSRRRVRQYHPQVDRFEFVRKRCRPFGYPPIPCHRRRCPPRNGSSGAKPRLEQRVCYYHLSGHWERNLCDARCHHLVGRKCRVEFAAVGDGCFDQLVWFGGEFGIWVYAS